MSFDPCGLIWKSVLFHFGLEYWGWVGALALDLFYLTGEDRSNSVIYCIHG